jgi:NAD dependent epimerase/dehydratase family enzyme
MFGEMSTLLLDGQRAVPKRLQELGYAFRFPQIEAALRDLLGQS